MHPSIVGITGSAEDFFFARIGRHLKRPEQRASFATYAFGLLGDGDRKSVEPIAARVGGDPAATQRAHDHLLHFLSTSPWPDAPVRREAAKYVIEALSEREPVDTWIIDDTGMLKQGRHSPGVQRQYTGSAGKVANCQIAVSLSVATATEQVPIDCELYLPESWTSDPERCERAHIPEGTQFRTRTEIAIDMVRRAHADGIPGSVVLADAAYGRTNELRRVVRECGMDFAMAVDSDTKVHVLDTKGRAGDAVEVGWLGRALGPRAFRKTTWRDGTRGKLSGRFCFRRVKAAHDDGTDTRDKEPLWLVLEWPDGEDHATKFHLTSLPRRLSNKQIVRIIKERWRTERVYQELKGELGFDHFEGRSFVGWNHHVTVALCCYAFVVAQRVRAFPPSGDWTNQADAIEVAA
jgi:SRSO17 transposase